MYKLCLFLGNAERAKFRINNIDNSNNFLTYCTYGKVSKDLSVSHVDNNISTYLLLYQLFSSLCTDKEIHVLDQLYRSFLCNCWSYLYSRCLLLLDSWLILLASSCLKQINPFQCINNNPPRFVYRISHLISGTDPDYMVTGCRFNNKFSGSSIEQWLFRDKVAILYKPARFYAVRLIYGQHL